MEQMTKVKRCVVDVVLPGGTAVLNADDPLVAGMAEYCKGSVIFFSRDAAGPVIAQHRQKGGRAVFLRNDAVWLVEGDAGRPLCRVSDVGLPHTGHFEAHLEGVLASVAAAWSHDVSDQAIAQGLASFA